MTHPSTATTFSPEDQKILADARASFCAFLSTHFTHLPDVAFIEHIRQPEYHAFLAGLAHEIDVPAELSEGARLMLTYLEAHAQVPAGELSQTLGIDRTRLYRGVSPAYGPPPPYETVWSDSPEMPLKRLQEIASLYAQDGLAQAADNPDRPDYIGVELAYLESLARSEAIQLATGNIQNAAQLRERQRTFLAQHLANWAPAFIDKALGLAKTDFYRGHLRMLRAFVQEQSELLAVE